MNEKWTAPSRKWFVTQVTALAALATAWLQAGEWSTTLSVMAVGIASQAAIGYLVPNAEGDRSSWGARGERGTTLVEALVVIFLILVILVVLFRLL
jgi:amino acid permease